MANAPYLKKFRGFIRSPAGFSQVGEMEQEFYLGSDRAAVILQSANIERSLETLLMAKMRRQLSEDVKGRIFEGYGPLSTFSAKILMGYALDLYGPVFRHDLDIIKELRNGFAHVRLPLQLTQPELSGMCANLMLPDDRNYGWLPMAFSEKYTLEIVTDDKHPRTRFTRACHSISLCFIELREHLLGSQYGVFRTLP